MTQTEISTVHLLLYVISQSQILELNTIAQVKGSGPIISALTYVHLPPRLSFSEKKARKQFARLSKFVPDL